MKTLSQLNVYSTSSVVYTDESLGSGQVLANRYQINGLLDTDKPVLENIEKLCSAAGSWLSYDIHEGKWGVVINQSGTSIVSFNDSNVIGNISVSGTGLQDLYNTVKVEFPHRELRDSADYINIEIPNGDRNANEEDNALNISYDIINDPVQANLLGFIELKQSRVDLVIRFITDFSYINLAAGDIIDITDSRFTFTSKKFRIIAITEVQDDDGALMMEITALEYADNIYSTADLYRYTRTDENGIITIGSIGIPGTPQVTKYEIDSRPRVIIESTSPTGVVDGMEFWLSTDTNLPENQRSYVLIAIKRPADGGTFVNGTNIVLDYDNVSSGTFAVKTRGFNATTVGPYSTVSGLIAFTSTQVTNAIGPDTGVIDALGGIGTALGAYALLKGVDGLYQKIANTSSLFTKVFETFKDATGIDLIGEAEKGALNGLGIAKDGTLITNSATSINFIGDPVTLTDNGGGNIAVTISGSGGGSGYTGSVGYTGSIGYTGSRGVQGYTGSGATNNNSVVNGYTGSASRYFTVGTRLPPDRATYQDPTTGATSDTASTTGSYYIAFNSSLLFPDFYNVLKNSGKNIYLYKSDGTLVETITSDQAVLGQVSDFTVNSYGYAVPRDILSLRLPFNSRENGTDYYILMDEGVLTYCNFLTTPAIIDPNTWNFNTPPFEAAVYSTFPSPSLGAATFGIASSITYPNGNIGCNNTLTDVILTIGSNEEITTANTTTSVTVDVRNPTSPFTLVKRTSNLRLEKIDQNRYRIKNVSLDGVPAGNYQIITFSATAYKITPMDCGVAVDGTFGISGTFTIPASSDAISYVSFNASHANRIDNSGLPLSDVTNQFINKQTNIELKFNKPITVGQSGTITIYKLNGTIHQAIDVSQSFTTNKSNGIIFNSNTSTSSVIINPTRDFDDGESYYINSTVGTVSDLCLNLWVGTSSTSTISWRVDPGPSNFGLGSGPTTISGDYDRAIIGSTGTAEIRNSGGSVVKTITGSDASVSITVPVTLVINKAALGLSAGSYTIDINKGFVSEVTSTLTNRLACIAQPNSGSFTI
jgi:hypothetical protein